MVTVGAFNWLADAIRDVTGQPAPPSPRAAEGRRCLTAPARCATCPCTADERCQSCTASTSPSTAGGSLGHRRRVGQRQVADLPLDPRDPPAGPANGPDTEITFDGVDLGALDGRGWLGYRGTRIGAVFQDPGSYLNPSIRSGASSRRCCASARAGPAGGAASGPSSCSSRWACATRPPSTSSTRSSCPAGCCSACSSRSRSAGDPDLLIADEATTALDVTVQAEVLDLLADLRDAPGWRWSLVSHDLAVVAQVCDEVVVMRDGVVVERGRTADVLRDPQHEYTRLLVGRHARVRHRAVPRARMSELDSGRLLDVRDLDVSLGRGRRPHGDPARRRPDGRPGEIVGLIGETGSGKTTLARTVLGLNRVDRGSVSVAGADVTGLRGARLRAFRLRRVSCSTSSRTRCRASTPTSRWAARSARGLTVRGRPTDVAERVAGALVQVGLDPELRRGCPAEVSGGQRQRAAIARAMVLEPRLLLCDEPVSALDASNRVQVLELLTSLRDAHGLGMLFISHDLGSVAGITDRLAVLYRGRIVESGPTEQVVTAPEHPYTRLLLGSAPTVGGVGMSRAERAELRAQLV